MWSLEDFCELVTKKYMQFLARLYAADSMLSLKNNEWLIFQPYARKKVHSEIGLWRRRIKGEEYKMSRLIREQPGRLVSYENKKSDDMRHEWVDKYIGIPGLIKLFESEKKHPGWHFVYFFLDEPEEEIQRYFHTSTAEGYRETENGFILTSKNSVYTFEYM